MFPKGVKFPLPGAWACPPIIFHFSPSRTKGVQGSPCLGLGGCPPTIPLLPFPHAKGVQGSPCRGFGGVPKVHFIPPPPRGGEGVGGGGSPLGDWSPTTPRGTVTP